MSEPTCVWNETARKNQKSRNSGCGLHWIKKCFPWSVQVNLFTSSIILSVHSILGGFTSPSVSSVSPKRSCDDSHNTQNIHPMPHLKLSMGGNSKTQTHLMTEIEDTLHQASFCHPVCVWSLVSHLLGWHYVISPPSSIASTRWRAVGPMI